MTSRGLLGSLLLYDTGLDENATTTTRLHSYMVHSFETFLYLDIKLALYSLYIPRCKRRLEAER
jgi:hypothetical protein